MGTLRFNAWQIELTTRCPLQCVMCIKDTYTDWHRRDMEMDNFFKILPYLKEVKTVVLEGWGESVMHRELTKIIPLVKAQGCEVGFVTSGFGLDGHLMSDILKAGIDFIGFSFSGASNEIHNSIRVNSDFNTLFETVKTLNRKGHKKPKIHIVYLILKKNIHEMPKMIEIAKEANIEEIVYINIIHITNTWQYEQKAFVCNEEMEKTYMNTIKKIFDETVKKAKKYKIKINLPNFLTSEVAICSENPLENLYISVDGEVSPCVYLYPPLNDGFKRIFCGKEFKTSKLSFGNIFKEDIGAIWNKNEYKAFRERFYERKKKVDGLFNLFLEPKRSFDMTLPDPPNWCKTCHKILGV